MFKKPSFIKSKSHLSLALAVVAFTLSFIFSLTTAEKSGQPTAKITGVITDKKAVATLSPGPIIRQNSQRDNNRNVSSDIIQKNKESISQIFNPAPTVTPIEILPTATATVTPSPISAQTATPTLLPNPKVTLGIIFPSEALNLSEEIEDGMNVCDLLTQTKNEGKIQSLAIDNSYLSTLKSAYVYEINGYKNNWTFTVNGASPKGCSLSFPKPGDVIVWKFSQ
jgi:hypothetical protein